MKLIDDDKWSMSVFLSRNIHVKKEGKNSLLIGEDIWQKYKKLLMNGTMDYSEKQVKLSEVRSLMSRIAHEYRHHRPKTLRSPRVILDHLPKTFHSTSLRSVTMSSLSGSSP